MYIAFTFSSKYKICKIKPLKAAVNASPTFLQSKQTSPGKNILEHVITWKLPGRGYGNYRKMDQVADTHYNIYELLRGCA